MSPSEAKTEITATISNTSNIQNNTKHIFITLSILYEIKYVIINFRIVPPNNYMCAYSQNNT